MSAGPACSTGLGMGSQVDQSSQTGDAKQSPERDRRARSLRAGAWGTDQEHHTQVGARVATIYAGGQWSVMFGIAFVWAFSLIGCTGHATVHIAPLSAKKISMTRPLIVRVEPDECYFWINDQKELWVAMRTAKRSLFGERFEREFTLSLVLDGLPAGHARQYRLRRRAMRAQNHAGYAHTRAASLLGLAVVWDFGSAHLNGRFRLTAKQQSYSVLTGWKGNHRVLFVGEFTAVHDRAAGENILERTEADGMTRPAASSKPVPIKGPPRDAPALQKPPAQTAPGEGAT